MIENLHSFLLKELENCNKNEITYVILGVVLFSIEIFVNLILASSAASYTLPHNSEFTFFIIAIACSILINTILILLVISNDKSRKTIYSNLSELYSNDNLDKYTSSIHLNIRKKRSILPIILLIALSIIAILIPILDLLIENGSPYMIPG